MFKQNTREQQMREARLVAAAEYMTLAYCHWLYLLVGSIVHFHGR